MKKYSLGFIMLSISAIFVIVLCTIGFKPVDSLMGPPKLDGENLSVQLAFESSVEKGYKLKSPIGGDYRSAYISKDLDVDGQDEVIVFYSTADAVDIIRMNVLKNSDGKWISVADFESSHSEIQQVNFVDIDDDGNNEILVGWAMYQNELTRHLNLYNITTDNDAAIVSIFDSKYSEFEVCDVDCDGVQDILIFDNDVSRNISTYFVTFVSFIKNNLEIKGRIPLDISISSIKNIVSDYDKEKKIRRIFVDGYKTDSGMITDCFYYDRDSESLTKIINNDINNSSLTSRTVNVFCKDIDKNSFIEIPIERTLPKSKVISDAMSNSRNQSVIEWVQFKDGETKTVQYQIINSKAGYCLNLPQDFINKVTVINNFNDDILTFYELKKDGNNQISVGKAIFSVKFKDMNSEENLYRSEFRYFGNIANGSVYYRVYPAGEEYGITKSFLDKTITDLNGEQI